MKKRIAKAFTAITATASSILAGATAAYADGFGEVAEEISSIDTSKLNAGSILASIINVVCYIGGFVGVIFILIGVFQIVMGFRNDDGESKSRGGLQAGCGLALLSLGIIFKFIFGS